MSNSKKVLVVDDDKDLCKVLSDSLMSDSLEVLKAYDGEEGLEIALKEHPDLILLDVLMPKMNGWEMLEKLRTDEWGKTAKVIVLTVLDDVESISRALEDGQYEYLVKTDWDLDEIVKKVRGMVE